MDTSSIELPGSEVESLTLSEGGVVIIRFSRAYIIKTMTGSSERTRWWQVGELEFYDAAIEGDCPDFPRVCTGGDLTENIYTYRDMVPIPLASRGRAHCNLGFEGSERRLVITAGGVKLQMEDRPRYIEHFRC